ncbi:hypothetical protein OCEANICA350_12786 [Oceanicaulis sp. 350]|nr:hypothetical protein OCEANICA350_12786 [Oceanicaulis sp. 350]
MKLLRENGLDAAWLGAQLKSDWRVRLFLTDQEALGVQDESSADRKSRAKPHLGGVLSRFASAPTLKRLQASGIVRAYPTARLDAEFNVAPGRSRAWPLREILKLELLFALAEMGNLPVFVLGELLDRLPGASPGHNLLEDMVDGWAGAVLADAGIHFGDDETRIQAQALLCDGPDARPDANRKLDPSLIIVDRRWLVSLNYRPYIPLEAVDPFPLAEIKSLRTGSTDFDFIFERYASTQDGDFFENDSRFGSARQAHSTAVSRLELNLAEPLRRFIQTHKLIEDQW